MRNGRHRGAKVGGLHVGCGGIFKCCLRIAGSFGSRIPSCCIEGRALAGTRHCVAPRLGRLRSAVLNSRSHLIRLRCSLFHRVQSAVTSGITHVRTATQTITRVSIFISLTLITKRGGCYGPGVGRSNIVSVGNNHRPIIRGVVIGSVFVSGSACLSGRGGQVSVVANPGVTKGSACVHRDTLVILVTRVKDFIPTRSTGVKVISQVFAHIKTSSSLTDKRDAFVMRVGRITGVLHGTATGSLLVLSRVKHKADAFSKLDVT